MQEDEFLTSEFFGKSAIKIWSREQCSNCSITFSRRFRAYFGTSSKVSCFSWTMLQSNIPVNSKGEQLLRALMFLKVCSTQNMNSKIVRVDEKTFRKWSRIMVKALSRLDMVSSNSF